MISNLQYRFSTEIDKDIIKNSNTVLFNIFFFNKIFWMWILYKVSFNDVITI